MAALCEYVYKEFTLLVSTSWDNLALFTPVRFWFHMGINWKHLNVYSSFYTEMKKILPLHSSHPKDLWLHSPSARHLPEFKFIRCYQEVLPLAKGSLTVSHFYFLVGYALMGRESHYWHHKLLCSKHSFKVLLDINLKQPTIVLFLVPLRLQTIR